MGWVAGDCADRLRGKAGWYRWDQWRSFCWLYGIQVVETDLPAWLDAVHVGRSVCVRLDLPPLDKARWVWHEVGHIVMHPGNCWYWDRLPWGHLVLSKQERQADEFAATFPVWEGE